MMGIVGRQFQLTLVVDLVGTCTGCFFDGENSHCHDMDVPEPKWNCCSEERDDGRDYIVCAVEYSTKEV